MEAFDAGIMDSHHEDLTCQTIIAQAKIEAVDKGHSTEVDEEWTKLSFKDAMPDEPDISVRKNPRIHGLHWFCGQFVPSDLATPFAKATQQNAMPHVTAKFSTKHPNKHHQKV